MNIFEKFNEIDEETRKIREKKGNDYYTIDDLPLTYHQKLCVLEWLAKHLWRLLLDTEIDDGHCKSYDPLYIEGDTAHSYIHHFDEGGRHHSFKDLQHIEKVLYTETLDYLKGYLKSPEELWGTDEEENT